MILANGAEVLVQAGKWAGGILASGAGFAFLQKLMDARARKRADVIQSQKNREDAAVAASSVKIAATQAEKDDARQLRDEWRKDLGLVRDDLTNARKEITEIYRRYFLLQSEYNKLDAKCMIMGVELNNLRKFAKDHGGAPYIPSCEEIKLVTTAEDVIKKSENEIEINLDPTTPTIPTEPVKISGLM